MKRIVIFIFWFTGLAALSILVGFIEKEQRKATCRSVEVIMEYGHSEPLITAKNIENLIQRKGDSLVGKKISELNLGHIEDLICQNAFVKKAEVYTTVSGHLKIKVYQKQPIMRIINQYNQNFYIDEEGTALPSSVGYSNRVIVASGNIPYKYSDTLNLIKNENFPILKKLYLLALYLREDEFLNAQFEQVYVNQDNEFELIPKVGRHTIILGDIDNMVEKFDKLQLFYQKGLRKAGWDSYSSINLKFKDQVVCTRK